MAEPLVAPDLDDHEVTAEDLFSLQDDQRYELIDGEVAMVPPPSTAHQIGVFQLARLLADHVDEHGLGVILPAPLAVVLDSRSFVEPDIVFVAAENLHRITERGIEGRPDLVVEVLSDSTRQRDLKTKFRLYQQAGIPAYWLLDPATRSLAAYRLVAGAYEKEAAVPEDGVFRPGLFPGLEIRPVRLWPVRPSSNDAG